MIDMQQALNKAKSMSKYKPKSNDRFGVKEEGMSVVAGISSSWLRPMSMQGCLCEILYPDLFCTNYPYILMLAHDMRTYYIYIIRFILQMRGFIDQFSIMFFDVNMYPDVMPNPFSVPLSVPPNWYWSLS